MVARNLIRIAAVAVGLSTLSFAAGVAGDLSMADPPNFGERVVLRLPPELPADTIRAAPLPPLMTATAAAESTARRQLPPIRVAPIEIEYLVSDAEQLTLVRLPKMRPVWLGKPAIRAKPA